MMNRSAAIARLLLAAASVALTAPALVAQEKVDVATIERLVLKDLKAEPQMYDRLLIERNRTWLPKIEALFSRPKATFVVVGAAHLVGTEGLLQMLRAKGYSLEQL